MSGSIEVKPKKKRGRPATGKDPLVGVRFPSEITDQVDAAAAEEGVSRSELIRRLVEAGLKPKV